MTIPVDKSPLFHASPDVERLNFIKSIYLKSCISNIIQRPFFDDDAAHIREHKYIQSYFECLARKALIDSRSSFEEYIQYILNSDEPEKDITIRSYEVASRILEIRDRSRTISCGRCSSTYKNRCCSNIGGQGECIHEISSIFEFAINKGKQIILQQGGDVGALDGLRLRIDGRDSYNKIGSFSEFSISTSTNTLNFTIDLKIKEDCLNRDGLLQLVYAICHEVLIHAMQGINSNIRYNVDEKCSWSEGFMDRVVFLQLSEWLNYDDVNLPSWLSDARDEAYFACHRMHDSRLRSYSPNIKEEHAAKRRMAIQACDELNKVFLGGKHRSHRLSERFLNFSYLLNTHAIDRKLREILTTKLCAFLNPTLEASFEYNNLVKLCTELDKHRDVELFIRNLGVQL
jgi:hypothetical protein